MIRIHIPDAVKCIMPPIMSMAFFAFSRNCSFISRTDIHIRPIDRPARANAPNRKIKRPFPRNNRRRGLASEATSASIPMYVSERSRAVATRNRMMSILIDIFIEISMD